jgi:hypothetical protein
VISVPLLTIERQLIFDSWRRLVRRARARRTRRTQAGQALSAEGRVTVIDGILGCAVLAGLVLNAASSRW